MARPKNERQAVPTRLFPETLRIFRTLASWQGLSMAEYLDQLAKEAVARHGGQVIEGLQLIKDENTTAPTKGPRKAGS